MYLAAATWLVSGVIRHSVLHAVKLETNVCEKAVSSEVRIDKHHLIAEYASSLFTVLLLLVYLMFLACQSSELYHLLLVRLHSQ